MYNTDIQTILSIRGHLVFLEYKVTPEWAVKWNINWGAYIETLDCESPVPEESIELLETLLRTYEHEYIQTQLLTEFESRQYEEEQRVIALAQQEDIAF